MQLKVKLGKHPRDCHFYIQKDNGTTIEIPRVFEVSIHSSVDQLTEVRMSCHVDEVDVGIPIDTLKELIDCFNHDDRKELIKNFL